MKKLKMCLLFSACAGLLLALAPLASATDGVTLINQVTAVRGLPGCTPASGTLITICRPGSYRLSGNLSATGNVGIRITTSEVTLDLNGFTLSGSGNPTRTGAGIGTGIDVDGDETTISNGVVSGFAAGIEAASSQDLTIRAVTVRSYSMGMFASGSNQALVENSVFETVYNTGQGVVLGGGLVTHCAIFEEDEEPSSLGVAGPAALAVAETSIHASTPLGGFVTSVGDNVCNGSKC